MSDVRLWITQRRIYTYPDVRETELSTGYKSPDLLLVTSPSEPIDLFSKP